MKRQSLMKIQTIVLVLGFFINAAAGASEAAPRFDYSTERSALESNRAVAHQLSLDRREALAAAIIKLGAAEGAVPYTDSTGKRQVGIPPERIKKILHGNTAEEIIALAATSPGPEVTYGQPAK